MSIKHKIHTFIERKFPFLFDLVFEWLEFIRVDIFRVLDLAPHREQIESEDRIEYVEQIQRFIKSKVPAEKRPIHFVLYTSSLVCGGAERQWCYLAVELAKRGYAVTVFVDSLENEKGHYLPLLLEANIRVACLESYKKCNVTVEFYKQCFTVESWLDPHHFKAMFAAINQLRPSHMLCQLDHPNTLGSAVAHCFPTEKILLSFRSMNPTHFPNIYNDWMLPTYAELARSERVVWTGNSRFGGADYAKWIGMDEKRIHTIHNAIDLPHECSAQDKENLRKALGIAQDAPVLLGVFRLSAEKNIPLFLQVVKEVRKELPSLVVLHVGIGPEEEDTKQRIAQLGLTDTVKLLGRREDVAKLMQISDVLLLTSVVEGLSNVVLEAQAVRLPVVATRVGGMPEALLEGETGLLADSGDATALSKHCLAILTNKERRLAMGQAGYAFIQENFSHKALGDKTLKALDLPLMAPHNESSLPPLLAIKEAFPAELERVQLMQKYIDTLTEPCIVFVDRHELAAFFDVPKGSVFVCADAPADASLTPANTELQYNWREQEDWGPLKGSLPPDGVAVFLEDTFAYNNYRQGLLTAGVKACSFLFRDSVYCVPSPFPPAWQRVCMGIRKKLASKVGKGVGG